MKKNLFFILTILLISCVSQCLLAQTKGFTYQDTLRGSITPERAWWDLIYYHLDIKVNPEAQTIEGTNLVQYRVLEPRKVIQIDLQQPMNIQKIEQGGQVLNFKRKGSAFFVQLVDDQEISAVKELKIHYSGKPIISTNPPWSGGLTWTKDQNGKDFIVTTCQGDGASLWWPCKDHMYDEPDSMLISVTVPKDLMDVSNGRLRGIDKNEDDTRTFHWFVSNPISNYVVNINIGDYIHFGEQYKGEKGLLDCDYYVIRGNLEKAKKHFREVPRMFEAFEHWFGPYPFYEDGFKLVEVPYLGMEHQSSITYGNDYKNGYKGRDISDTGWGFKFDYIIVHESGHEWFANNITYADRADMWVHEGFTTYSENLFLDYHFGKKAAEEYVIGTRKNIRNDRPIIAPYHVNAVGSGDMYSKGANMLHTLRQLIENDEKWRSILRSINKDFYHQTVTSQQIETYLSKHTGIDLQQFFDQYLRDSRLPVLEYRIKKRKLFYRWTNIVNGFDMPIKIKVNDREVWIQPNGKWQKRKFHKKIITFTIDKNFYIKTKNS